jgi:flagellar motor switch protein FliN/FliY
MNLPGDTPDSDQNDMADDWAAALAEQSFDQTPAPDNAALATNATPHVFSELSGTRSDNEQRQDIDLILDIPVQLTVELGRTRIPIKHILQLAQGSVIELDAMAGEPMDVLVNGCLIAQGEVVVVNDKFGIRLTDIVTPTERVRRINRG